MLTILHIWVTENSSDFLRDRRVWGMGSSGTVEIKQGLAPKPGKGFYLACEDLNPDKRFVVYSGKEKYSISAELEAISLEELAKTLSSLP